MLIVNTCGFINAAKEESVNALRELVEIKRADQMVIAAGCLSQRYGDTLVQEVPRFGWRDRHAALDGYLRFDFTAAAAQASRPALSSAGATRRCGRA